MEYTTTAMKKGIEKDIFLTGEYVQHFYPDERRNPFFKIYDRKKHDTISIINKLKNTRTILDVGGGMGRLSLVLSKSSQRKVTLTDISIEMLRLAVNRSEDLANLQIVNADAHQLPYQNDFFDLVVGLDIFCHLGKPEKALSEFNRVLKPKGMLIIDSTNSNPLWAFFYPRYLGKNPLNWLGIIKFGGVFPGWESIVRHYPKKTFFSLLQQKGFKLIQNINYGPVICPKWHLAVAKKIF